MGYTNSSLVNYTKLSPSHSGQRTHVIDTLSIHCLPIDETELLTRHGWISLRNVNVGDEIATCDENRNIIFDNVIDKVPIRKDTVYKFSTGFVGTKEHRMLFKNQYDLLNNKPYKVNTLKELIDKKSTSFIPNSGMYKSKGLPLTDDEINFICAVQADGSYQYNDKKDDIYYIRFRFWKPRKIEQFKTLISNLNYNYTENTIYGTHGYEYGIEYKIYDKNIIKMCETYLTNKVFNYNLLELSDYQAKVFINSLTNWDGTLITKPNYTEKRYTSRISQNIDVVMAIGAIHNIGSRFNSDEVLTFKELEYRSIGKIKDITEDIEVSCVTVPSGFILIRQNGRPSLVGNCMAGDLSVETCGNVFQTREASSNYGVGSDGRIGMYVEEKNVSWCTSNSQNDNRAITIEVANDGGAPDWHVSDKAMTSLIKLCADICKRNGIKKLLWKGDKNLVGQVDKQNMTVHRWFTAKACVPITTEVLTKNGWKTIDSVEIGEEIACPHIDDLSIKFYPVLDKVDPRKQDTYTCNGFTGTKDHRMVYKSQKCSTYKIDNYKNILGRAFQIPLAGYYNTKTPLNISDDLLRFLIAVQADGCYMYEYDKLGTKKYYGIEFHLKKERKINRIKEILNNLGLKYNENKKKDGSVSIRIYNYDDINIVLDIAEKYLEDKKFPWKFIDLSTSQAKLLLSEIFYWDGSYTTMDLYFSKEKQNIDIVSALCAIHGIGSNINEKHDTIHIRESNTASMNIEATRNHKVHKKNSDITTVTCVTVPTGIFLCRQNGKTFVIGNCPGDYLYNKHGYIADEVNKILNQGEWKSNDKGRWYEYGDGSYPKSKWLQIDGYWYYFDDKGYAICESWKQIDKKWYYFDKNCKMVTGWLQLKDQWYYLNEKGDMAMGLKTINNELFYLSEKDGHMCKTDNRGVLK